MGAWGTGVAAAVVPAAVSTVVTRALMWAVEVLTNGDPEFTVSGLLFIGVVYTTLLLPGCLALALSRARWPWFLLAVGVALLGFQAVNIGLQETAGTHDMSAALWAGLVLVLLAMLATYATQVAVSARWARYGRHGVVAERIPRHAG